MEKRIELERRGQDPKDVTELILDNCRAATVEGLTEEYSKLEILSLINAGLTTLKGFPSLPSLLQLELSDNRISGQLEYLKGCSKLQSLKLSNNRLSDLEVIAPLKELAMLSSLDLIECPVSDKDNFRAAVFEAIPQLKYLDGAGRNGEIEPDSDEDYDEEEEDDVSGSDEGEDEEDDGLNDELGSDESGSDDDGSEVEGKENGEDEKENGDEENAEVNGEGSETEEQPSKKIKLDDDEIEEVTEGAKS